MALSGPFGAFWWEVGDLSVGAQIFTLPSSWNKLVFCIRRHLTDRIQLLNVQNHLLVKSFHPWNSRNESVHPKICLGKAISSLPQAPRQRVPALAGHPLTCTSCTRSTWDGRCGPVRRWPRLWWSPGSCRSGCHRVAGSPGCRCTPGSWRRSPTGLGHSHTLEETRREIKAGESKEGSVSRRFLLGMRLEADSVTSDQRMVTHGNSWASGASTS